MSSPTASVLTAMTLTLSLAALACTREQPRPTPKQAADEQKRDEPTAAPAEARPKIAVDEAEHDFGKIAPTDIAEHVFTIKNTGDADLVIDRVQKT